VWERSTGRGSRNSAARAAHYFRYNVLPDCLSKYRLDIERMMIRDCAAICQNKRGCEWRDISGYHLANDKVDK